MVHNRFYTFKYLLTVGKKINNLFKQLMLFNVIFVRMHIQQQYTYKKKQKSVFFIKQFPNWKSIVIHFFIVVASRARGIERFCYDNFPIVFL